MMRTLRSLLLLTMLLSVPRAHAQPAGSGNGDFTTTVNGTPSVVIPAALTTRSMIIMQVQGAASVACRPDGVPSFNGGSYVLLGASNPPYAGGSLQLTGAGADPRAWSCVTYPVGGIASSTLTIKVYP